MNVPKLRFKEFTDVWKEYPLKYFTTPIKRKNINNESDLPLTISSLDGLVDQRTYFNKVVASKDMSNYYLLKKGEFAYNKSYSVGFPFGSIKRLDKYNQGALSSLYICFQVNNMNSDFIVKYFESPQWHKQISLCVAEGARNHGLLNVNINDFFSTKHFLPQLAEQEKIANFLAIVDKKIINLENTITSLENQKKGLLQQIFSQKLRFKDKNGNNYPNWEKKKLEDIAIFLDNKRKPLEQSERIHGKYPYYGASGIIDYVNNYIFDEELILLSEDGANIIDRNYPICYIATGKYWVNNHAHVLKTKSQYLNKFLCEALERLNYNKYNTGTAQPKLNQDVCRKIILSIPCLEEQTKIADFLSAFDRKLDNQKAQLEHWQQIKKGLLQQMFV